MTLLSTVIVGKARRIIRWALPLLGIPGVLGAQMTVAGQVTSADGNPVQGASISISALNISARTNAAGRYNFIIRAAEVRGQTVAMVARHGRFGSETVQLQIVGGFVERNFVLTQPVPTRPGPEPRDTARGRSDSATATPRAVNLLPDAAGPIDLTSAMAGRYAPLRVISANTPGASSLMIYRGVRSFIAPIQPLVVVDGVPVDNLGLSSVAQRFGLGGFDYGTPLSDIALDDIASAELLDPVTASAQYGSRAANGVLVVKTKTGKDLTGFRISATTRYTGENAVLLPKYQNLYGQGSGGLFEFFDGQGGGINDAVSESWGPALDARAIAQHSLTEPGRPDVRHWLPQTDDVRDYFDSGRALDASIALLGSGNAGTLRAAFNARGVSGLTPGHSGNRLGLTVGGSAKPSASLSADANVQLISASAEQRPGTGFDEINPVAGFARMGRQVDLDALRANLTDENGEQINWIYTNRNNPFFATSLNANDDERRHIIAGIGLTYDATDWVTASLRVGTDDVDETRKNRVASGWNGGYRTSLGLGDFSGGGTDKESVAIAERFGSLTLGTSGWKSAGFDLSSSLGAEFRSNSFGTTTVVNDQPIDGAATLTTLERNASHEVTSVFLTGVAARGQALTLKAGARLDQSSSLEDSYSAFYPSVAAEYDLARTMSSLRDGAGLEEARLIGRWWQSGNEITRRTLLTAFFDGVPIAPAVDVEGPERTSAFELGARVATAERRLVVEVLGYRERTTDVLVATGVGDGSALVSQTGEIFNGGVEASVQAAVSTGGWLGRWDVAGSFAHNSSTVDKLRAGVSSALLSPNAFGAQFAARVGSAAGVIVGSRPLRDASGALILRNGVPIPDASAPFSVLGSVQPDWTASLQSRWRWETLELSALLDMRFGGKIFSATNLWGSSSGNLENTLRGDATKLGAERIREDSLLVAGIDSLTGAANATRVSAEQYFHAIGRITEPWVFDASFTKLRDVRLSYAFPTRFLPAFREHTLRLAVIGRNLVTWSKAPNIDPETALGVGVFQGFEMGQLPSTRTIGVQLSIVP